MNTRNQSSNETPLNTSTAAAFSPFLVAFFVRSSRPYKRVMAEDFINVTVALTHPNPVVIEKPFYPHQLQAPPGVSFVFWETFLGMDVPVVSNRLKCVRTICIRLTRLVKNKLRVSLKVSTSFSASINHSFSASGSPESMPCQSSCKRWYPRMTSASFCASSSLSCGCVNLGARGCVLTLCCAFSSKREVEPKLS